MRIVVHNHLSSKTRDAGNRVDAIIKLMKNDWRWWGNEAEARKFVEQFLAKKPELSDQEIMRRIYKWSMSSS